MSIDLFTSVVPESRQHAIFRRLMQAEYAPERAMLASWADGFLDRDGKFIKEFQLTFESAFWELYLNAALRRWNLVPDMSFTAPDFVIPGPTALSVEATIAGPAQGGKPAFGYDAKEDLPDDFTEFNIQAAIRICNAFDAKVKRFRTQYAGVPQIANGPYVIAIAPFDRPYAHFATSRPILAALYGLYFDEAATPKDAVDVVRYNVSAAPKSKTADVPVGLFCDDQYAEVSAVIYGPLATWGKLRALAENPTAHTIYQTYHPSDDGLRPKILTRFKHEYHEDLLDGLYVLHNPFARHPVPPGVLAHPRISEVRAEPSGRLNFQSPDDFLLLRTLRSVIARA